MLYHRSQGVQTRGGGGRGCTQYVHGRSGMTIDPRIPTIPGRSTSRFHRPGRHLLAPSAKRREVFGRVAWKVNCILPRAARKTDFGTLCLLMDDSADELCSVFWFGHSTLGGVSKADQVIMYMLYSDFSSPGVGFCGGVYQVGRYLMPNTVCSPR